MENNELYIGIMSGTSLDGIDTALLDYSDNNAPKLIATYYQTYPLAIKEKLLELHISSQNELHKSQLTANELSRLYAEATANLLQISHLNSKDIRAIGCHGQTIRHCPEQNYTIQLCNAALLAELSGITVVNDFRSRDIAAGGQGAPLVPAFHDKIFRHPTIHRAIINIGGISNLTNLPPDDTTRGFDCGPGNLLMDAWINQHLGHAYDKNGEWAASGVAIPELRSILLSDPYFLLPPPKSCGRDLFNMDWLKQKLHGDEAPENVQATLLELTAYSISSCIKQYCIGAQEIFLCGGGAHNTQLVHNLKELLPDCSIQLTDKLGIEADWLEAIAFSWLARLSIHGLTGNLPAATGAQHPCILGAIHQA